MSKKKKLVFETLIRKLNVVLFHAVQARRVASFLVLGAILEGTVNIFLAVDGLYCVGWG